MGEKKNTVTLYIPMIGISLSNCFFFFKQFKYVAVDMYAIVADALVRDISGMFVVSYKFLQIYQISKL